MQREREEDGRGDNKPQWRVAGGNRRQPTTDDGRRHGRTQAGHSNRRDIANTTTWCVAADGQEPQKAAGGGRGGGGSVPIVCRHTGRWSTHRIQEGHSCPWAVEDGDPREKGVGGKVRVAGEAGAASPERARTPMVGVPMSSSCSMRLGGRGRTAGWIGAVADGGGCPQVRCESHPPPQVAPPQTILRVRLNRPGSTHPAHTRLSRVAVRRSFRPPELSRYIIQYICTGVQVPNEKAGSGSQVGEFQIGYTGTGHPPRLVKAALLGLSITSPG